MYHSIKYLRSYCFQYTYLNELAQKLIKQYYYNLFVIYFSVHHTLVYIIYTAASQLKFIQIWSIIYLKLYFKYELEYLCKYCFPEPQPWNRSGKATLYHLEPPLKLIHCRRYLEIIELCSSPDAYTVPNSIQNDVYILKIAVTKKDRGDLKALFFIFFVCVLLIPIP